MSAEQGERVDGVTSFRLDVREATQAAAAGEFRFHGCLIALVSAELADEWSDWSPPVRLKLERGADGLAEITVMQVSPQPPLARDPDWSTQEC